jgi:PAS domain S-box-containing protein
MRKRAAKRAKGALQSSERLFRSIFESAQIGIGVFNIETQEHFCNRALGEILGYSGDELTRPEQWDEIVPAEERTACAQRYSELVQGKRETDEYEQHFIHRTGRMILGNSRFRLLRDSAGKPQYVVALTEDITEHRRSTEALRSSEQLFRTVFENAQIGIGILNIKTGEHLSNRTQTEILGYRQEDLSRVQQWDEIVHPDDRATGAARYSDLVQGLHDADEFTQRFIRRDGQIVTQTGRYTLIRDSEGNPDYVIALHEDITERLKAEEALAASERLFRTIFENAQIGISVVNISAQQYHTNRALHEMLGCTSEDLSSVEKWDLMVHPDEREAGAKRYADLVAGKLDRDEWEQRFVRPDGRLVIANGRFSVLRDVTGRALYVLNLSEDITERRRATDALAASERLFRTIFENAQIGISVVNISAQQYHTNRALHEMLGCTSEDLSSVEKWDLMVHPDEREAGAKRYADLVAGKLDRDEWEQRFVRPDGRLVIANGRFSVLRDVTGRALYVLNLSEDITERRRAEKELREAHETLAQQLLAINNELELARQTQLSILPKDTPRLPGLEIAARYMPMSAVAGDFYDFVMVDEKHVGILIADVSGHGLSAALVASMLKSALPAQLPHASDPARVLSGLNQALFGKFEAHYVTAAYVFVDMANNTVSYAGAAHPPLLWWHANTQHASECLENGLMLGPFRDSTYSAMTFALEKGDEIILVTDGILEARDSSGDQFGMDRLRTTIESNHALSANAFADALLAGLSTWSETTIGPGQTDDITLIVLGFQAC